MRQLKDFKALISEKTVPKSIKILKRTVLVLVAILIILTSVQLKFKFDQVSNYNTGIGAVYEAY